MVRARKRFGQHFLEPAWVTKLVAAIAPQSTDRFIEIGPGRGAITAPLAAQAGRLIAIEVDRDLAAELQARALPNVTVLTADVLDDDFVAVARAFGAAEATPMRIVGNLPYNISSPILFKLLDASKSGLFTDATLMLQKEVADRLIAKPGTGDYGVLTLSTNIRADVIRLLELPPERFAQHLKSDRPWCGWTSVLLRQKSETLSCWSRSCARCSLDGARQWRTR